MLEAGSGTKYLILLKIELLGKQSDDIDIALDDMKGSELAKILNDELYPGEEKFGVVEKNNEKSKHLETATMKVCGTFIDFVNLRNESYTNDSRVPQIVRNNS